MMILFRGETEVEEGFRAYCVEQDLAVDLIVRNVDRRREAIGGFVAEARELRPDLVYTWGTSVTLGVVGPYDAVDPARHLTDIPVVFTMVSTPVESKVVRSLASSDRNVTGVSHTVPLETQIRAMRAYRPVRRLATIYNADEENSVVNVRQLQALSLAMDFELLAKPVPPGPDGQPDPASLPGLIEDLAAREPQFLYIGPDTFIGVYRDVITQEAIRHSVPAFTGTELEIRHSFAMVGLVSRYVNVGRFTAYKAAQVFQAGAAPSSIPVETLKRFGYLVRMPVARQLALYPPVGLLSYAELVE
jgi:putative ABC transport system substrate-binding protein